VKSHANPLTLANTGENMPRRARAVKAYPRHVLCDEPAELTGDTRPTGASSSASMPATPTMLI
jgi:hypothetical protein